MGKNIPKVADIIIFIAFSLLIAASSVFFLRSSDTLEVKADDTEYLFPLKEDGIYSVEGVLGITTFEIKDKKVRFLDSPCPNKSCISKGFSDTVVCLPNKVIATTHGEEEDIDAIAE